MSYQWISEMCPSKRRVSSTHEPQKILTVQPVALYEHFQVFCRLLRVKLSYCCDLCGSTGGMKVVDIYLVS